jgi:glycerol kinase
VRELYLAIDQGGHASRAMLFDEAGCKVGEAFAPVATHRGPEGFVEHDPVEVVESVRIAADQVLRRAPLPVVAAGLATQRSSMVCWSRRSGAALSPVISWQDRRNADWLRQFEPRRDWIRAHTGLALTPHYGASKMRWCLDHLPAARDAAAAGDLCMGPLASYLVFRLVHGQPFVADPANASRTQLWDPATRDWSEPLLQLFGVPRSALPRCVSSRFDGCVLYSVASVVPLTVVTGDQSAVPFAFGPLDPAAAYVNVGTGAFVQRAIRDRMPDAPQLLASVVWSDDDGVDYMLEGTVNGAGSALDWLALQENIDVAAALRSLESSAGSIEPPLFLNGVSGLGSPFWISDFQSRFVGEGPVEARALGVLESIVFLIRVNLDELARHGPPLQRIVLTGGIAASDLFCQRLADVAGLKVWRSRETEATARGLAWLIAGGPMGWPATGDDFSSRENAKLQQRFVTWLAAMHDASGYPPR